MIFYLIGGLCLVGFFRVLRRGRGGHCHHGQHGHRGRGGPRWRRGLDYAFNRLDTSPGQEKEIRSAVEAFLDDAVPARREMKRSLKDDLIEVLGEDVLDADALRTRLREQETRIEGMRESLVGMVTRVHAALDAEQREMLRSFFKRGPGRRMTTRGPFR